MSNRGNSLLLNGVASAGSPTSNVTWNMLADVIGEAMKNPAGFAGAIALLDPSCCLGILGIATVCGVTRFYREKRSREEQAALLAQIKELAEKAAAGMNVFRDIADGTIELKVNVDEFVKADIAAAVAEVTGQPGSPLRKALREEFIRAIKDHGTTEQVAHIGSSFPYCPETLEILLWTIDHRGREHTAMLDEHTAKLEELVAWIRDGGARDLSSSAGRNFDNLVASGAQRNNAFVGRRRQLDELSSLLGDPHGPTVVAIVGGVGIGKTEVVKQFMNCYAFQGPSNPQSSAMEMDRWTARWWLDGSKAGELTSLVKHFHAITGRAIPSPPEPTGEAHAEWLQKVRRMIAATCSMTKTLLVVDNVESVDQIKEYSPVNASRLIVTSRRQTIPPSVAREMHLELLTPPEAREVLTYARRELFSAEHLATLDELSVHCGHHALALAYVAAALAQPPQPSPSELLARLKNADVGDPGDLFAEIKVESLGTAYRRPLAQSFAALLDPLTDPSSEDRDPLAAHLLRFASFCAPQGIPLDLLGMAANCDRTSCIASLRSLHERSLITLTATVWVHVLTQSLVRGRVRRDGNEDRIACQRSVLDACVRALTDWDRLPLEKIVLWSHSEAILGHARLSGDLQQEVRLLHAALSLHLCDIGQVHKASEHASASLHDADGLLTRAMAHMAKANVHHLRNDLSAAVTDVDRAIELFGEIGDSAIRSYMSCRVLRARILLDKAMHEMARRDAAMVIEWARGHAVGAGILGSALSTRGRIHHELGMLMAARADIEESIAVAESRKPRDEHAIALRRIEYGRLWQGIGDHQNAILQFEHALNLGPGIVDERSLLIALGARALSCLMLGDLAKAHEDIDCAIRRGREQIHVDERALAIRQGTRAQIRHASGDFANAQQDIEEALAYLTQVPDVDHRGVAIFQALEARILRDQGHVEQALAKNAIVVQWAQDAGNSIRSVWIGDRGTMRIKLGDSEGALSDVRDCVVFLRNQLPRNDFRLAEYLLELARVEAVAKEWEAARQSLVECSLLHDRLFGAQHVWAVSVRQAIGDLGSGIIPRRR